MKSQQGLVEGSWCDFFRQFSCTTCVGEPSLHPFPAFASMSHEKGRSSYPSLSAKTSSKVGVFAKICGFVCFEIISKTHKTKLYRAYKASSIDPIPLSSAPFTALLEEQPTSDFRPPSPHSTLSLKDPLHLSHPLQQVTYYIIKTINADVPTLEDLAYLRHEYRLLGSLGDVAGVVRAIKLESFEKGANTCLFPSSLCLSVSCQVL
jgi:hypothetical protein